MIHHGSFSQFSFFTAVMIAERPVSYVGVRTPTTSSSVDEPILSSDVLRAQAVRIGEVNDVSANSSSSNGKRKEY